LSDDPTGFDPAVALIEFSSIAAGIEAGDAMVKASPVGSIYAGTVHPGKYLVLVSGDTATVEVALGTGIETGGTAVIATVFLPDIHPAVTGAIAGAGPAAWLDGESLGIVETTNVAVVIEAADAAVKAAAVEISAIRLADGLGGKGYALFTGVVGDVEAALEAAVDRCTGALLESRLIPQLHSEMAENLARELQFLNRVSMRPAERGA
jgi:microcompartment protein CcmL/EutN